MVEVSSSAYPSVYILTNTKYNIPMVNMGIGDLPLDLYIGGKCGYSSTNITRCQVYGIFPLKLTASSFLSLDKNHHIYGGFVPSDNTRRYWYPQRVPWDFPP